MGRILDYDAWKKSEGLEDKEVLTKWNNSGLLDWLDEDLKVDMSYCYEIVAKIRMSIAITTETSDFDNQVDVIIYAVMRRVMSVVPHMMSTHDGVMIIYYKAIEKIRLYWKEVWSDAERYDHEAEMCARIAEELIKEFELEE